MVKPTLQAISFPCAYLLMEPLHSQRNPSEAVFFFLPWFPKSQDGQEIAEPGMQIVLTWTS